jgi:hypothetical protein
MLTHPLTLLLASLAVALLAGAPISFAPLVPPRPVPRSP